MTPEEIENKIDLFIKDLLGKHKADLRTAGEDAREPSNLGMSVNEVIL